MSDTETFLARDIGRDQLVAELRHMIPVLRGLGVEGLSLFGSRARGDNREDSDIDLIVDVQMGRKFSLLDLIGVAHVVEDRIGLPANVFMRRSLEGDFLKEAHADEVVIFRG
jgi:predicted nucleotidyltransferase